MGSGLPGREQACILARYLRANGQGHLDRLCIVLIYTSRRVKPQKILLAEHSVEEIERGGIWPTGPGAGLYIGEVFTGQWSGASRPTLYSLNLCIKACQTTKDPPRLALR